MMKYFATFQEAKVYYQSTPGPLVFRPPSEFGKPYMVANINDLIDLANSRRAPHALN